MIRRAGSIVALLVISSSVPAGAAALAVAVHATTQATVGVTYASGHSIACDANVCAHTATLAGSIRSTRNDPGGTSIFLSGFTIADSSGNSIPVAAFRLTCSGGIIGNPAFPGTPGSLAQNVPLSAPAIACQSWSGTIVADYRLVVALSVDANQVPADAYAAVTFNAIASAN